MTSDYVGVDYGVRRLAWARLLSDGSAGFCDELVLPIGDFLTGVPALVSYIEYELMPQLSDDTRVVVEAPITGASGNPRTAAQMAIVAGAIITKVSQVTPYFTLVPPATWKKSVVGRGNAMKRDVRDLMENMYGQWVTSQDVADALAMATYAFKEGDKLWQ